MVDLDWNESGLLIHGVQSSVLEQSLKKQGYSTAQVASLVSATLAGVSYATPTAFRFATSVEATDPQCQITYRRTFAHDDWTDGRSRVQAGTTPDELGFNARFHALESELDAVAAQFDGVGRCLAGLRADLHGIARELESVLSTLRREVAELRREQSPVLPKLENWARTQRVIGYQTVADGSTKILLQKGEEVTFLDAKNFVAKFTQTFEPGRDVKETARDLGRVAGALEVDDAVRRRVAFGVTRDELVEELGGRLLDLDGQAVLLADVLADVPGAVRFTSVQELSDAVATAAVNRTAGGDAGQVRAEVLAPALQDATAAKVREAEVTALVTVSPETSSVVTAAGFTTIGKLAETSAGELVRAASKAGLELSLAQAHEAVGGARLGLGVARLR